MRKKSRPSRRTVSRFLACEALENRCLLTIAAFTINLYEDTGTGPGELIADDVVQAGERFYVEILAREYDPLAAGLRGVALDIAWDPAVFQEIDAAFEPADPTSQLVTADFPLFRAGELDNHAGTIENLAGAAFLSSGDGRAIGNAKAERFSLLHFQALQPAENSPLSMRQGLSSIVTVPVFGLEDADLYFEQPTITVMPGSEPDGIESASLESPSFESPSFESPSFESPVSEPLSTESPHGESGSRDSQLVEQALSSLTEVLVHFVGPLTAEDYFQFVAIDTAAHGEGLVTSTFDYRDCWSREPIQPLLAVPQSSYRMSGAGSDPEPVLPGLLSDFDLVIDEANTDLVSETPNSQPVAVAAIDALFANDESITSLDDVEEQLQQLVDDRSFPL